jgi:hypothetical protein
MSEELDKFQVVCPECSSVFDLDKSIANVWCPLIDHLLRVTCPECECVRLIPLPEDEDDEN